MALLEVEDLSVFYGSIQAVKNVSFSVEEKEIVTLLGTNGAGKSTVMRTLMGLESPKSGRISYKGQSLLHLSTGRRVAGGMTLVPEGRRVFPRFSVEDNLLMGGYLASAASREQSRERVYSLFPRLKERAGQPAGTLSGGEQQMLAIGRALMAQPKLLLLDEPSLGLAPLIVRDILSLVSRIRDMGTAVLLVEQNARSALKISDRAYVLESGRIAVSGSAQELLHSPQVQKAYLGM